MQLAMFQSLQIAFAADIFETHITSTSRSIEQLRCFLSLDPSAILLPVQFLLRPSIIKSDYSFLMKKLCLKITYGSEIYI